MTRKRMGRPRGRAYPINFQMYASQEEFDNWADAARARGLRTRNEFIRRAADHALTCPLFMPTDLPPETVDEGTQP